MASLISFVPIENIERHWMTLYRISTVTLTFDPLLFMTGLQRRIRQVALQCLDHQSLDLIHCVVL